MIHISGFFAPLRIKKLANSPWWVIKKASQNTSQRPAKRAIARVFRMALSRENTALPATLSPAS
jgi:hypothetical protein